MPFVTPIEAMRQNNAAKGLPPTLTGGQRAGVAGGSIIGLVIAAALASQVYPNEGGYADHPNDRGGKTMYGVTERTARDFGYHGQMRDFPKHCSAAKPICADLVYTTRYIDKPGYRPMAGIEPAVFFELVDSAVLHGPGRPSMWFQASINTLCSARLGVDGKVGPATIRAYQACQQTQGDVNLCLKMLETLDATQKRFFDRIVANNPSQRVFYRGWVNRRVGNVPRGQCADWTAKR